MDKHSTRYQLLQVSISKLLYVLVVLFVSKCQCLDAVLWIDKKHIFFEAVVENSLVFYAHVALNVPLWRIEVEVYASIINFVFSDLVQVQQHHSSVEVL